MKDIITTMAKYFRLKQLSQLFNVKLLTQKMIVKHRNRFYCYFDKVFFEFPTIKDIIIPEAYVSTYLNAKDKLNIAVKIPSYSQISYNLSDLCSLPVVAILGHFDHGKTTLLDRLGGTSLCSEEVDGITQTVRMQCIHLGINPTDGDEYCSSIFSNPKQPNIDMVLSDKWITCVDTPGQDFFYRMRNYGASVADIAILVVAIDSGVCLQTQESIGIVEGLNIPVVVVINKIDLYRHKSGEELDKRLVELEKEIREFVALSQAIIIPISAKYGTNIHLLKRSVYELISNTWTVHPRQFDSPNDDDAVSLSSSNSSDRQKSWASFKSLREYLLMSLQDRLSSFVVNNTDGQIQTKVSDVHMAGPGSGPASVMRVKCTGLGTVVNLWKSPRDGTALSVMVSRGSVSVGDHFSSGGWSGVVKRIFLLTSLPSLSSAATNKVNKSVTKRTQQSSKSSPSMDQSPSGSLSPTTGIGAGSKSMLSLEHATPGVGVKMIVDIDRLSNEPRPLGETIYFFCSNNIENRPSRSKVDEQFKTYVDLLADSQRMEYMYYNYALSDTTAESYRLPQVFTRMKKLDAKDLMANTATTTAAGSEEEVEEEASNRAMDWEEGSHKRGKKHDVTDDDENDNHIIKIVLKADSDIVLGTITDTLQDIEVTNDEDVHVELTNHSLMTQTQTMTHQNEGKSASSVVKLQLVSSGVGEVIGRDVLIAHAARGFIFAYNVSVQQEAAKQAMRQNVKIIKFNLVQDILTLFSIGNLASSINNSSDSNSATATERSQKSIRKVDLKSLQDQEVFADIKSCRNYLNSLSK